MAQDSLEDGSSVMGEFNEIGSRDSEEEFGMAEQNDGEIYIQNEMVPPGGDIEDETGPPGGDIEDETGPPGGDIDDEAGPPGSDNEALVAPPGEDIEYEMVPSGGDIEPITSIYMRSIVEQAGINVSENLTISTSEGEREAQVAQDTPDEDAEQLLHQQPLDLLSQTRGEISLHERTDYNPFHNMRLIMESNFGQSGPVSHTLPAVDSYLSERNFNMEHIVTIWDNPHIYQRDQLLSRFWENSLYRPNIVQRGGFLALLHMLNSINGVDTDDAHALRDCAEGVLLNSQSLLYPVNGHFRLGVEYICVHHYNPTTLRCCLPNSQSNFIRKTFYINEWCKEQMIVSSLCGNCVVQPLGLTWGQGMVNVFLPVIEGIYRPAPSLYNPI